MNIISNMSKRIEICGGIATGKTTLATLLAKGTSYGLALENFRENPFWAKFYERPDLFTAEKNICFLAQHTGEIKAAGTTSLLICDYAVIQDLAYASLCNTVGHGNAMKNLYDHLYLQFPPPSLIVHLKCDPATQLQRIRERGRKEEASITQDYLESLNRAIELFISKNQVSQTVFEIRSDNTDFAHDPVKAVKVRQEILSIVDESDEKLDISVCAP